MARKDAGFTLLEIIFVLIIIGVASTMIGSHYASLRVADSQLERAKVQLISAFVQTRNKAILMEDALSLSITEEGVITQRWSDGTVMASTELKDVRVEPSISNLTFDRTGSINSTQTIKNQTIDGQEALTLSVTLPGFVEEVKNE